MLILEIYKGPDELLISATGIGNAVSYRWHDTNATALIPTSEFMEFVHSINGNALDHEIENIDINGTNFQELYNSAGYNVVIYKKALSITTGKMLPEFLDRKICNHTRTYENKLIWIMNTIPQDVPTKYYDCAVIIREKTTKNIS